MFVPAERLRVWARVGLVGPSGSGKTYSSLLLARGLGQKIAVIDTEQGSAAMYAGLVPFDVAALEPPYTVERYLALLEEAQRAGYDVIIIDSLSPAWIGRGGLLELQEKLATALKSPFGAWREIAPKYQALMDGILAAKAHIVATFRAKTAYEVQEGPEGKKKPVKIGIAPQFREGVEYEFMIMFELLPDHTAIVWKDRTGLFDGLAEPLTSAHGEKLRRWLESGRMVLREEPRPQPGPAQAAPPALDAPAAEEEIALEPEPEPEPEPELGDLFAHAKPGSLPHMVLTLAQARGISRAQLAEYVRAKYGAKPTTAQWLAVKRALEKGQFNGRNHG